MQGQNIRLSLGKSEALPEALIICRPPSAASRSESWSNSHWRARALGANPGPSKASAAENNQHGKQNADRCGASGGNPGGRGKRQSGRGIRLRVSEQETTSGKYLSGQGHAR